VDYDCVSDKIQGAGSILMQCISHSDENMGEVLNRILRLYNILFTVIVPLKMSMKMKTCWAVFWWMPYHTAWIHTQATNMVPVLVKQSDKVPMWYAISGYGISVAYFVEDEHGTYVSVNQNRRQMQTNLPYFHDLWRFCHSRNLSL
jgi:hypothetical protein